jgi:hypothetical protein
MLYAPQLCISIEDYKLVRLMVDVMFQKNTNSLIKRLSPELLTHIVEYAYPGLGPLIYSFVLKKNITAEIKKLTKNNIIITNFYYYFFCNNNS